MAKRSVALFVAAIWPTCALAGKLFSIRQRLPADGEECLHFDAPRVQTWVGKIKGSLINRREWQCQLWAAGAD